MSKIAEQKALEAYPPTPLDVSIVDYNSFKRTFYVKGYDQALQDFLEKAEEAISQISRHFIGEDYTFEQVWECFKNYMENEMQEL